jgi:cytochrome c553
MNKKLLTLTIATLLSLVGCNKASEEEAQKNLTATASTSDTTTIGDISEGKILYDTTCVNCHIQSADYVAYGISRKLTEIATQKDFINALYALKHASTNASPSRNADMINVAAGLSDADIENASAYFNSLK